MPPITMREFMSLASADAARTAEAANAAAIVAGEGVEPSRDVDALTLPVARSVQAQQRSRSGSISEVASYPIGSVAAWPAAVGKQSEPLTPTRDARGRCFRPGSAGGSGVISGGSGAVAMAVLGRHVEGTAGQQPRHLEPEGSAKQSTPTSAARYRPGAGGGALARAAQVSIAPAAMRYCAAGPAAAEGAGTMAFEAAHPVRADGPPARK